MLSSRKSLKEIAEIATIKRSDSYGSSRRHNPLSSRGSIMHMLSAHQKRRSGKRLWRVGIAAVRFLVRTKRITSQPKLTADEVRDVTAKFYSVMCLNDVSSIMEFLGSLGIHVGSEATTYLASIKFRDGQALTLYQVLRLLTMLKRRHVATAGSDTTEAFSALAVDGRIPTEVFRATLMKFDLRVQYQDGQPQAASPAFPQDTADDGDAPGSGPKRNVSGIDLARFRTLLSDEDDAKKRDLIKRRFSRLTSVQQAHSLQRVSDAFEASGMPESRGVLAEAPKPFEALLSQVRQSINTDSEHADLLFKKDTHTEKSPLRGEVFPFRSNKRRWDFKDVVQRIDDIEAQPDVHRAAFSRNARYCSDSDRPRLALLTPFTDLGKKVHDTIPPVPESVSRLSRLPPRGLPDDLMANRTRRSVSVPLTDRYPILSKRRERLMSQMPHRDFTENGSVPWAVSQSQRSELVTRMRPPCCSTPASDENPLLRHMAAATLAAIRH